MPDDVGGDGGEGKKRPVTARSYQRAAGLFSEESLKQISAEDLLFLRDTTLPAMRDAVDAQCKAMAAKLAGKP